MVVGGRARELELWKRACSSVMGSGLPQSAQRRRENVRPQMLRSSAVSV